MGENVTSWTPIGVDVVMLRLPLLSNEREITVAFDNVDQLSKLIA